MGSPVGGGGSKVEESQSSKALAQIGKEEWERFQTDFAPHEKEFIGDVTEIGSNRERDTLAGRSVAEMKQQAGPAQYGGIRGATGRAMASAKGRAGIATGSDTQSLQRKAKGIGTAIGLGRDIATGSMGEMSRSAQMETSKNIASARAKQIKEAGKWDLIGTAGGYGISKYGPDVSNYAGIATGDKYNTKPFSEQSRMLANQEWGIR